MLDLGWTEIFAVTLLAIIVVGPRDLPRAMQTVGRWVRKARNLTRDFQSSVEQMAREADIDEIRDLKRDAGNMNRTDLGRAVERHADPDGEIRQSLEFAEREADGQSYQDDGVPAGGSLDPASAATPPTPREGDGPSGDPADPWAPVSAKSGTERERTGS